MGLFAFAELLLNRDTTGQGRVIDPRRQPLALTAASLNLRDDAILPIGAQAE